MSTSVNYDALGEFVGIDETELDYIRMMDGYSPDEGIDEDVVESIFNYYRKVGFPHYKYTEYEKLKTITSLRRVDSKSLISNGIIRQTMNGLGLAWSYFPHSWKVRCNDKISPMDAFMDDERLRKVIRKCLMFSGKDHSKGRKVNDVFLRKILKISTGVQGVSNFRPTAAAAIYETYGGDGVVWDMSCGWGGRLLGALMAKNITKYIGTEPATLTCRGVRQMAEDFMHLGKNIEIHCMGSENYLPKPKTLDLCFTSPPYFDNERYSEENTQSYKKFSEYEDWKYGFYERTMMNCKRGLKSGSHMLINIANIAGKAMIEDDTIELATKLGFIHEDTLKLTLSALNRGGFKFEPVFVFRKP